MPPPDILKSSSPRAILFTIIRIVIAIALFIYLGYSGTIQLSSLAGLLPGWRLVLMAVLFCLLAVWFQSWRLSLLMSSQGMDMNVISGFRLTMIGMFFNTFLPGSAGGDLAKLFYVSRGNSGKKTELFTIILFDRFVGMFTQLLLPIIASMFFFQFIRENPVLEGLLFSGAVGIGVMLALVLVGFLPFPTLKEKIKRQIARFPLGNIALRILNTLENFRKSLTVLLLAVFLSIIAQLMVITGCLFIAEALNHSGADPVMIVLIPLGLLANTLPITPGGLGVGEVAFESLFSLAGLGGGSEVLLGLRLVLTLVSLGGLAVYLAGGKQFVRPEIKAGVSHAQT